MISLSFPQVDTFLKEIERVRNDYKAVHARVIAYNVQDTWVNLASRFMLSTRLSHSEYRLRRSLSQIPELILMEDTVPLDDLDRVLDIFRKGELTQQGSTVLYKRWMNQKWDSPYSPQFLCMTRNGHYWEMSEYFGYWLRASEGHMFSVAGHEAHRRLEARLSSLKTPFKSLADLATDFLGPLWLDDIWQNSSAEVIAPIEVRFVSGCELESRNAVFRYEVVEGYRPSDVSVGYVTYLGPRALSRGRVERAVRQEKEDHRTIFRGTLPMPGKAEQITLLLSYRGEEVDRLILYRGAVAGRNPRMSTYEVTDPKFKKFAAGLVARDRKARDLFEQSVLNLFHFLGFSCVIPPSSDAVDIVAFTGNPEQLLLIECTTDAPDLRNKLAKLSSRRRIFGRAARVNRPVALLATSLRKEDISPLDTERALKEGIIVLASETLGEMVSMANKGVTATEVMVYLSRISPSIHFT